MLDADVAVTRAVFAKTAAGQQEVLSKALKLGPTLRRVLILVDGKRNVAELDALLGGIELADLLGQLMAHGCIELLHAAKPVEPVRSTIAAKHVEPEGVAEVAQRMLVKLPPKESRTAKDVETARNFLVDTINMVFPQNTQSTLMDAILASKTAPEVRRAYVKWEEAMGASLVGAQRLPEFREKLFKAL